MSVELDKTGNDVEVGNVVLRTPGLTGVAESHEPAADNPLRGPEGFDDQLADILREQDVRRDETIEITEASEEFDADESPGVVRRTANDEPAFEMDVNAPNEGQEQVVLYTDEFGVTTWSFARDVTGSRDITRGSGGKRTYVLRRSVPVPGDGRGPLGDLGSKFIRVLRFPIVDDAIGFIADKFVDRWEQKHHRPRLRTFTVDDKATPGRDLTEADLDVLRADRALLLIHGTGSSTQGGLGGMVDEVVAKLHEVYGGRVFAFDHPTIGTAPRVNAANLLSELHGQGWKLDIVTHSRGGLVARYLIEQANELGTQSGKLEVGKVVFVGVPNAGTPLADVEHLEDFINTYTTLINVLGQGVPPVAVFGTILALAKQIAAAAFTGLDGLTSMDPDGDFLTKTLNVGPGGPEAYFALASNYEPPPGSGLAAFRDALHDSIFKRAENDMIVPTVGVFQLADGASSQRFPVKAHRRFEADDAVDHSAFFRTAAAAKQIQEWLTQ